MVLYNDIHFLILGLYELVNLPGGLINLSVKTETFLCGTKERRVKKGGLVLILLFHYDRRIITKVREDKFIVKHIYISKYTVGLGCEGNLAIKVYMLVSRRSLKCMPHVHYAP